MRVFQAGVVREFKDRLRVTGLDIPYPPPKLEHLHLPGVDRVLDAVARLQWDDTVDDRWLVGTP